VIDTLNQVLKDETITEESEFDADLGLDQKAKELLFFPIEKSVIKVGCKFKKFTTKTCGKARNVGEIVDVIAEDFGVEV
jgi:hypothetical protein